MENVTQIPKIDFVDNATTKEAFVYSCRYTFVFWRNVWRSVNCFVHRWPWFCVAVTALLVIAISHASIGQARAERDYANKQAVKLQEQVESLSCAVEAGKEVAR